MHLKTHNIVLSQYLQRHLTKIFIEPGIQKLSINKTKLLYPFSGKTLFFYVKKEILVVNVITELPKVKCTAIAIKFYKKPLKIFRNIYNIYFLVGKQKMKNYFLSFSLTKVLQLCGLHQGLWTYDGKSYSPPDVHLLAPEVADLRSKTFRDLDLRSTTSGVRRCTASQNYLKKKLIILKNLYCIFNYLTEKNRSTNNIFFIHQLEQDILYVSSSVKEKIRIYYVLSKKPFSRRVEFSQNHSIFFYKFQLIRPLFFITRLDTFYVCESLKLPNYPDKTNLQVKFLRNRIRKQILPAIRILLNPQIDIIVCNFSESFYDL